MSNTGRKKPAYAEHLTPYWPRGCWKKKIGGRVFYFRHPITRDGYRAALAEWKTKEAELRIQVAENKPHREDYERAIRWRRELRDACSLEIEFLTTNTNYPMTAADAMRLDAAERHIDDGNAQALGRLFGMDRLSPEARRRDGLRALNDQERMYAEILPRFGLTVAEYNWFVAGVADTDLRARIERQEATIIRQCGEWMANRDIEQLRVVQRNLDREIGQLQRLFQRATPPPLNRPDTLPINPLEGIDDDALQERFQNLGFHDRFRLLTGQAAQEGESISDYLDHWLRGKLAEHRAGGLKASTFRRYKQRLEALRSELGNRRAASLSYMHLDGFRRKLLDEVAKRTADPKKGISSTEAKHRLNYALAFVAWMDDQGILESPIKGLRKLRIKASQPEPEVFTPEELAILMGPDSDKERERTRLFLLLMLNCGMYAADIARIRQENVDWQTGRLTYKRAKEEDESNVPTVIYPLFDEVFDLLTKYRSSHREWVLVNANGQPLHRMTIDDGMGDRTSDNIRTAIGRTYRRKDVKGKVSRKPSDLRNTGASGLFNSKLYSKWEQRYLGHSPQGVAAQHYRKADQAEFEEAIIWLGDQFGFATDQKRLNGTGSPG